jgi:hypothetical protein
MTMTTGATGGLSARANPCDVRAGSKLPVAAGGVADFSD